MSIIYDALKKVERSQEDINSSVTINRSGKPKTKIYLVYIFTLCLGFFIASMLFNSFTKSFRINSVKKIPDTTKDNISTLTLETNIPSAETKVSLPTESKEETLHQFILNGIFFSQDQGYALINNQIVKEGDLIDGALVLRVSLEEVVLESKGSTIKLYANR